MTPLGGDATEVVRLFHGWASSAIWFPGPLSYDDSDLSPGLIKDLAAWDEDYYAGLSGQDDQRSESERQASARLGVQLARRLAGEIGDEFLVEVDSADSEERRRFRAPGPARNPEAASTFRRLVAETRSERARTRSSVEKARRQGHTLEWRAF